MIEAEYKESMLRVIGLHSVIGVAFKTAKSIQFRSFAESIDEFNPDIVAFDANEPKMDHYDIEQMVFFDNMDNKGEGARLFFKTLSNTGLRDSYVNGYDTDFFIPGEPLAISHHLAKGNKNKRYDFVFHSKKVHIDKCTYLYEEALKAGSDHALICCECQFL